MVYRFYQSNILCFATTPILRNAPLAAKPKTDSELVSGDERVVRYPILLKKISRDFLGWQFFESFPRLPDSPSPSPPLHLPHARPHAIPATLKCEITHGPQALPPRIDVLRHCTVKPGAGFLVRLSTGIRTLKTPRTPSKQLPRRACARFTRSPDTVYNAVFSSCERRASPRYRRGTDVVPS